jgi:predicted MFS family arabinose efflux permease
MLFTPAVSSVGHWFKKRRAFATGVACTAGGSGGVFFPLIVTYLAPRIGFGWTIRVIGLIYAVACIIACLLLRKRLPPNKKKGASIDLKALKDVNYALTTLAVFLIEFAVFIPYQYIPAYAIHVGMSADRAYRLSTLLNAGAIPGRALPGYVADRFGAFNTMCGTSLTCCVFIFALWLTAGANEAAITAFAIIFGFWSGAAISLTPVCVASVCKIEDYGKRNGTTFAISSFGALVGIPIAGALLQTNGGGYWSLIVFSGASYFAAFLAFLATRVVAGGWSWKVFF